MTRNECARYLAEHDNFCILTHTRPDGDTIGSASALCLGLRQLGKTAHILENRETTKNYAHLHQTLTVSRALPEHTVICVDVASASLLPDNAQPLLERIALRIDHHGTATPFTPAALVDPNASACGDVIFDVLMLLGVTLDKAIAEALYIAVSTDTGCFRYSNTTGHTHAVAGRMFKAGCDFVMINRAMFEVKSFSRIAIEREVLNGTELYFDNRCAVISLTKEMIERTGVLESEPTKRILYTS